jgi:hypothetical protein
MKTCIDFGIELCPVCKSKYIKTTTCWLNHHKWMNITASKAIYLLSVHSMESPFEIAVPYFLKCIEIHQPEVYKNLSKLLILL